MSKFVIGDIVRLTEDAPHNKSCWDVSSYKGDIGIIVQITCTSYAIKWRKNNYAAWFDEEDLELVKKFDWKDFD